MNALRDGVLLFSAGEASGDVHGARLLHGLAASLRGLTFAGTGGPRMRAAGLVGPNGDDAGSLPAASGAWEWLRAAGPQARQAAQLVRTVLEFRPRHAVLIGNTMFHLAAGQWLRGYGVHVIYYGAPQFWAWWPSRLRHYRGTAMLCFFPFELEPLRAAGIDTQFAGHPLAATPAHQPAAAAGPPALWLFPCARPAECAAHDFLFHDTLDALAALGVKPTAQIVHPLGLDCVHVPKLAGRRETECYHHDGMSPLPIGPADVGLIRVGTASLEAALAGLAHVATYRAGAVTAAIARWAVRTRYLTLPNLLLDAPVVPELVQAEAHPRALAAAVAHLWASPSARDAQRAAFAGLPALLGAPNSIDLAVRAIVRWL